MIQGCGLGFRREMQEELDELLASDIDFVEIAPENWMRLGGQFEKTLSKVSERKPLACHGLSLSIGSPDSLDIEFLKELKVFLDKYKVEIYSEHLSYCSANGHMYDLMPIPFTQEAVDYVADRVKQVQDVLERPLVLENVSYYLTADNELTEVEFTEAVLEQSGCQLLLDVNNVYVNSINHNYDPISFIKAMPTDKIRYCHIAGHYDEADDLKVDTHGADVIDNVWQLLKKTYDIHGVFPTLLERDFNIPPVEELLLEVTKMRKIQHSLASKSQVA